MKEYFNCYVNKKIEIVIPKAKNDAMKKDSYNMGALVGMLKTRSFKSLEDVIEFLRKNGYEL